MQNEQNNRGRVKVTGRAIDPAKGGSIPLASTPFAGLPGNA